MEALNNDILDQIVDILNEKKARDIKVLYIGDITLIADYFVICSGTSTTHVKTLADELEEKLEERGIRFHHKEGYSSGRWVLMDYGSIVVHIFHPEDRIFYSLERIWADAKEILEQRR